MLNRAIDEIENAIKKRCAVFLIGAGASIDPPTQFPAAIPLANEILFRVCELNSVVLRDIFGKGTSPEALIKPFHRIGRRITDISIIDKKALRLEVLLEELFQSFGSPGLECLTFMRNCTPNVYHDFLATCFGAGCSIMTTNFDSGIEDACRTMGFAPTVLADEREFINYLPQAGAKNFMIKLHGGLNMPLETLGATLTALENGITGAKKQFLDTLLKGKHLIVIGYSGSDHFDITPYLLNWQFEGITWVNFNRNLTKLNVSNFQQGRLLSGAPIHFDPTSVPGILISRALDGWWIEGLPVNLIEELSGVKYNKPVTPPSNWWKTHIHQWSSQLNPALAAFAVGRIAQGIGLAKIAEITYEEALRSPSFGSLSPYEQANIEFQKEYLLSLTGKYQEREDFVRTFKKKWSGKKSELKENWHYITLLTEKKLASCMIFDDRLCKSAMHMSQALSEGWFRLQLSAGKKEMELKIQKEIAESNTDLIFMSRIYLRRWFFELPGWLLDILYRIQRGAVSYIVHRIFPVRNGGIANRIRAMQYMGATKLKSLMGAPRYYSEIENLLGLSNTLRESALEMIKDYKKDRSPSALLNARELLRLSLFVSKQIDDVPGVAKAYHHLAWLAYTKGDKRFFQIYSSGADKYLNSVKAPKWRKRRLKQLSCWQKKL